MQIKISKTLQAAVKSALDQAESLGNAALFPDLAFLDLIGGNDSHALCILKKFLRDWELHQIKMSVEYETAKISADSKKPFDREAILNRFGTEMAVILDNSDRKEKTTANSGHFLMWILRDGTTAATKTMSLYGITLQGVAEYALQLPTREDYYDDIKVLERLREIAAARQNLGNAVRNAEQGGNAARKPATQAESFEKLGTNLTDSARAGRLDDVIGRGTEIERLVQVLSRRKKSNPVLIGEAGVGKSAIVEGLALKIAAGDVPASLRGREIFSLDVAALVSGTRFRGDFEERIKAMIDHLAANNNIILFIDEIHNIVGAGASQGGSMDASNILKAALARGDIRCIGATTLDEYRTNIEKDAALERRFQKILVEPLSAAQTLEVIERIKPRYEEHHNVEYSPEALAACVGLTGRYLADRNFPDKAIDLLDEAGAMARLQSAGDEKTAVGISHVERVITLMTGIPAEQLETGEMESLRDMGGQLARVVVGQDAAVDRMVKSIRRGRTGLGEPDKPLGVFMFVGPTGVGKTHLAKELSRLMFKDDGALIRIDMSEYSEKHNVSRLIGPPPGYVGHGDGGHLTEKVRRHPYSVVLFDEIEKAHPELFNVMLQILDEGRLTDGLGRKIDFRNTVIIMTSNVGSRETARRPNRVGYRKDAAGDAAAESIAGYRRALEGVFAPEFINRIDDIVVFNPLSEEHMSRIVDIEIAKLAARVEGLGFAVEITAEARKLLVKEGYEPRYGVRSLRRTILDRIEEPLADMIVEGRIGKGDSVSIDAAGNRLAITLKIPA